MKALILAAGYATRLYPLTKDQPKALLPIGGKTIMDFLVEQLNTIPELKEAHIITNHRFVSHFEAWAAKAAQESRYPNLRFIVWDDNTTCDDDKLGAVGDIQYVIEKAGLDDDLLIAASDNFFTFPLTDYYNDFMKHGCDTLLGGVIENVDDLRRFAVAKLDSDNRVELLVEKPADPPSNVAIYALYMYRRDTLPLFSQYLAEGNSPDAPGHFPEWLYTRKEVRVFIFDGEIIDIGTHDSYREVCERFGK